ncbi:hypothetical protein [Hubei virga-like virus 12]|uniref:hypothetical protein n=1 Tax=Hubei virga-like virus 12 TaxID=1923327 RepID=UPI00090C4A2A|nr:hypothetical protein [Hubei virga-like virus 12]APG77682.1 hypothetical protein [Hubei virga-like virus 12]
MLEKDEKIKNKKYKYITKIRKLDLIDDVEILDIIKNCYTKRKSNIKRIVISDAPYSITFQEKENLTNLYYNNGFTRGLVEEINAFDNTDFKTLSYFPVFRNKNLIPSVDILQDYFDNMIPNASYRDYYYDPKIIETANLKLNIDPFRFNPGFELPAKNNFDKLQPFLKTHMPATRPNSYKETLLAALKRNLCVPQLQTIVSYNTLKKIMVKKFISAYIPKENRDILRGYLGNKIDVNIDNAYTWLNTQQAKIDRTIDPNFELENTDLEYYNYMIKPTPKPVLDTSGINTYSALQTIAYHNKNINSIFCSIFKIIKNRLINVLDKRFRIFTDCSTEEFSDELNKDFSADMLDKLYKLEIDLSKYDKSQGKLFLDIEIEIYRILGVPIYLLKQWYNAHLNTTLYDRINKLKFFVQYQRKSGNASTYLGNTIVLMVVIASLFNMDDVELGLFSGDDSLLLSKTKIADRNHECANLFNLESKFFNYKYSYFCSKFILNIDGYFKIIPDPLKILIKFGRSDLVNYQHLEDYRISTKDLLILYNDANIDEKLGNAMRERYKLTMDVTYLIENILAFVNDKEKFKTLFYIEHNAIISRDPSRPNLD